MGKFSLNRLSNGAGSKPDFDIAVCCKGFWSIVSNTEQLRALYKENFNISLKNTWLINSDLLDENIGTINAIHNSMYTVKIEVSDCFFT